MCGLSFGEVMIFFAVSFLHAQTLVKYIDFTYIWILGFVRLALINLTFSENGIS